MTLPNRQRGVALITALLVVALASAVAVTMISRQEVDIRRTENLINYAQAQEYGVGGERWAARVLFEDKSKGATDDLDEDWAQALPPIPVPGGIISGQMIDAQSRFNLNNLVDSDGKAIPAMVDYFERLLAHLDLNPALAQAVVDWIDSDLDTTFPDGAEDDYYLLLQPAYRSANRFMNDVSELRLIKDLTNDDYVTLRQVVTALPKSTPLNINTIKPDHAALIAALDPTLTVPAAESALGSTYSDVNDFLKLGTFSGMKIDASQLTVGSDYFFLMGNVQIGRTRLPLQSLLQRAQNGRVEVIYRTLEETGT